MKLIKVLVMLTAMLSMSGCATRTGTAIVAGTAGMIFGNAIAQPRTVIVQEVPFVTHERVIISNATCNYYTYSERVACERGVRQRYYEEQRRRDNEAFRSGYGHR